MSTVLYEEYYILYELASIVLPCIHCSHHLRIQISNLLNGFDSFFAFQDFPSVEVISS